MRALVDAGLPVDFRAVISNRPGAQGIEWAKSRSIATRVVDHKAFANREAFDAALARAIDEYAPDLVLLAGFMRILTEGFITRYQGKMLNIHPSLLPAFPGVNTHARALAAGVKVHGATVHVVTAELDSGPIVIQGVVPVLADDTEEALAARVLAIEHRIYPQAVRWFVDGKAGSGVSTDSMISPREMP